MVRASVVMAGAAFSAAALTACAVTADAAPQAAQSEQSAEAHSVDSERTRQIDPSKLDLGRPYIGRPMNDAISLIPAPPAEGTASHARDTEANAATVANIGDARWELAARDADLRTGAVPGAFSCAAGVAISDEATPAIANLIRRVSTDFAMSTSGVKRAYQRPRPFMSNGAPTCTPEYEPELRGNGSYPSGHSALGYGVGLVLASIFPDRAEALVARGRAYGNSRQICNVHWLSDIEEARVIASATFAKLQADEGFLADLAAARAEAVALAEGDAEPMECEVEAAALSSR